MEIKQVSLMQLFYPVRISLFEECALLQQKVLDSLLLGTDGTGRRKRVEWSFFVKLPGNRTKVIFS